MDKDKNIEIELNNDENLSSIKKNDNKIINDLNKEEEDEILIEMKGKKTETKKDETIITYKEEKKEVLPEVLKTTEEENNINEIKNQTKEKTEEKVTEIKKENVVEEKVTEVKKEDVVKEEKEVSKVETSTNKKEIIEKVEEEINETKKKKVFGNAEKKDSVFLNGIYKENPVFVLMLGMCPTLAVTTSLSNAIGMGLSTTVVLVLSNVLIAALRNIIPNRVRMPAYIVIVASFVTMVQLLMQAFFRDIYNALGIYIPLIVVNCIIFGRAESFASKNTVLDSFWDGLGMGVGFTLAIAVISFIRELIGSGAIYGHQIISSDYTIGIFVLAPGAFLVLAFLNAILNKIKLKKGIEKEKVSCNFDCANCAMKVKEA